MQLNVEKHGREIRTCDLRGSNEARLFGIDRKPVGKKIVLRFLVGNDLFA